MTSALVHAVAQRLQVSYMLVRLHTCHPRHLRGCFSCNLRPLCRSSAVPGAESCARAVQSDFSAGCSTGATDIITANTEVATEMGSRLLGYLGANANGVRILVRELRKQMDSHVVELAEELMSDKQHLPKDPDGYVYKVDQKLLSSAVRLSNL